MTNDPTLPAGASLEHSNANAVIPRFSLASESPAEGRFAELRALFPEAVHDGRFDVDQMRRAVGDWSEDGPERFGLTWPGKAECVRVIQQPSIGTLLPVREESIDFDISQNAIIEGDNLEVLKLLQKGYYGKVKLIYIDPPYNTGKEFIYPDNFKEGLSDYLRYSGQTDAEGMRLSANAETDGRYHSKWLSMMYPRLFLARNLLRDDGVMFVSIDDHEMHNLRLLMNDVFGEEAFIACCVWQKRYSRENRGAIGDAHEYLVVYGRDTALFQGSRGLITPTEKQTAVYRNPNADPKGRWRSVPMTAQGYRPNQMYEVVTPSGARHRPPEGRCWSCIETEYLRLRAEGRIYFGQDGSAQPGIIRYLSEMEGLVPWTWWPSEEVGHTDEARKEIQEIFGTQTAFDTPKPTRLMKRVLEIGCGRDDIVLDFFAGSGTMGQAVIEQNATDGGRRRFVLVQLPEPVADDPTRPVADDSTRPVANDSTRTVADVTRTRVRWAIERSAKAPLNLGGNAQPAGFRAYRLTSSNFAVWEGSDIRGEDVQRHLSLLANNIVDGRSQTDLLTELLMKAGYPLTANVAELAMTGKSVFSIDDNSLLICLEPALTIELFEAMAALKPSLIIVLDVGFGNDDQLKVNALQTIRSHRSDSQASTELKVV